MTFSKDIARVERTSNELNEVLEKFYRAFNEGDNNLNITTRSGRTYKVANVLENNGDWIVTDIVAKGAFLCNKCGQPSKIYYGNTWLQLTREEKVVRINSSLIHLFKMHPHEVPEQTLEKVASVLT